MDKRKRKARANTAQVTAAVAAALQLLQSISSGSGPPSVMSPVCSVALQVIQLAQTAQQNRETCNELVERISQIMVVILTPYLNQKVPDMTASTRQNIERLTRDLIDISTDLRKVLGKNVLKAWAMSSYYNQKIAGCSTKLDWAMNVFKVDALLRIEVKLDALALQQANSTAPPLARTMEPPLILPPKPEIFYGRDEVIEDLANRLVSTPNGRFSIGGPGGLGKTSVALTAVHDPRVAAKFGDCRYWVPCDQAQSASSLIQVIARSLDVSTSSGDPIKEVLLRLRRNASPKLLLLDNFETPWDSEDQRPHIEGILAQVVSVPYVTLLLTVRSERPPCSAISWTTPILRPLATLTPDAARQLYIRRDPEAADNPSLDTLLSKLSYLPLAVTLMSARGAYGETPEELLNQWQSTGTATLGRSGTKLDSVQASIRLSTESQTMRNNPNALELLSLLTLLPAGAPKHLLPLMAPDINTSEAFLILQKVSLAYLNPATNRVSLLSPIQQYITEFHPPTEQRVDGVFQAYRNFLSTEAEKIDSEHSHNPIREALATHFPNVEAIVLKRLDTANPQDAIDLAAQICLWRNSPANLRLIRDASTAAERIADPALKTKCKLSLAKTVCWVDRSKAIPLLKETLLEFQGRNQQDDVLLCLTWLAEWLHWESTNAEAIPYAEQAVDLAKRLGNDEQYADSLEILGRIDLEEGRLDESLMKMEEVYQLRERLAQTKGHASLISTILIYEGLLRRFKRFEEAHAKLDEAASEIPLLGDKVYYEGWHQLELGHLYADEDRIDEALEVYTESAVNYRKGEFIEGTLWRQTDIGRMLIRKEQYDEAQAMFQRTLDEARENGFSKVADFCIGKLEDIENQRRAVSSGSVAAEG